MTLVGITGFKPDVWTVDCLKGGSIPSPSRQNIKYKETLLIKLNNDAQLTKFVQAAG